jgi:hypothetical protein
MSGLLRGKLLLLAGLCGLSSHAGAAEVKSQATGLAPYTQAYEPQGIDERGMWMVADENERQTRDSRFVIKDEGLNAYVRGVLCKTVGEDRCHGVRLYIMRVPAFNAQMAPNGMMTIWSGLLLRAKSEAELGAVLGHEFGHFEQRHSLDAFKRQRTTTDIMSWASILMPSNPSLSIGVLGGMFAFNRGQETEADVKGFQYLAASPYPASAAANIWERMMAEQDATAAGRKRKVTHRYNAGFTASHPTELTRATYLRDLAAKANDPGDERATEYRMGLAKWLPEFLDDQVKLNDFGGSEYLLGELALSGGWSPDLLFARAELYRQRGNPRDLTTAAQFYREAIDKGLTRPEASRGLGLALMRSQETEGGKLALRHYLELKPDASDASMIASLIGN